MALNAQYLSDTMSEQIRCVKEEEMRIVDAVVFLTAGGECVEYKGIRLSLLRNHSHTEPHSIDITLLDNAGGVLKDEGAHLFRLHGCMCLTKYDPGSSGPILTSASEEFLEMQVDRVLTKIEEEDILDILRELLAKALAMNTVDRIFVTNCVLWAARLFDLDFCPECEGRGYILEGGVDKSECKHRRCGNCRGRSFLKKTLN